MKQSIVKNDDDDDDNDDRSELKGEKFVPFVFGLLGIGLLLPWNAFISAKGYFESRLETHDNFMLWFGFVYNGLGTLSLALMLSNKILCGSTTTTTTSSRYQMKTVVFPLAVFLAVFVFTSMLVLITSIPPVVFLHMTLVSMAICGSASAVAGAGIIFVTSFFPPQEAVNPFVAGQSAGGVIISAINLITTASSSNPHNCHNNTTIPVHSVVSQQQQPYHVDFAAFTYFGLCSLILGLCILSYILLERLPVTHFYRTKAKQTHSQPDNPPHHPHDDDDDVEDEHSNDLSELLLPSHNQSSLQMQQPSHNNLITDNNNNVAMAAWNFVYYPALSIFISFVVTLTLFPSWITKVQSIQMCHQGTTNRLNNDLFVPITILLFNIGDLLGRIMAKRVSLENSKNFSLKLFVAALARFIFFPLFLLCNVPGKSISVLIDSDSYFFILLLIFAVSNGLVVTLAFMHAPQLLPSNNDEMQEVASTILTFAVSIGLLSGSTLSFLFNFIGTGKWM